MTDEVSCNLGARVDQHIWCLRQETSLGVYLVVYQMEVEAESAEEAASGVRALLRGDAASELVLGADSWEIFDGFGGKYLGCIDFEKGDAPLIPTKSVVST
ncbi:MAG: hypothetical protein GEU75_00400 [Dehalococcoidia bacterium]|nr:hypothetical protein [Dehalococcoidia bacterium]